MFFLIVCIALGAFQGTSVDAQCEVVTRVQWNALNPRRTVHLERPVNLVIIGQTATTSCSTDAGCADLVRDIQEYQMNVQNYWDIGTNFLVGGNAKIYEGTGWLYMAANASDFGSNAIAIFFMGYNDLALQNDVLTNAARLLIDCGVTLGHVSPNYHLVAQQQLQSTGRALYTEISTWPHFIQDVLSIVTK